jgi:hypothetical protein
MPVISFFADENDVKILLDRLNADPEIAFIVPDGPLTPQEVYLDRMNELRLPLGDEIKEFTFYTLPDHGYRQRWKAVRTLESPNDGKQSLWHVPSGPLPLLTESGLPKIIPDAWKGWTEQRVGADPMVPYFGPNHPGEIRLELWTRYRHYSETETGSLPVLYSFWNDHDTLAVSDFEWIGGRYSPAPPSTKRWWNRLKAWFRRTAVRLVDDRMEFWTFPSALARLKGGISYYSRGFDLDDSIRAVP